jgi:hypothetical protein
MSTPPPGRIQPAYEDDELLVSLPIDPKNRDSIWDHQRDCDITVDEAKIKRRDWIYGSTYLRGAVTMTVGGGGTGKSDLGLTEAIALVTGKPLLGIVPGRRDPHEQSSHWRVPDRHQCLYFNAEESRDELLRRVAAICRRYDIDRKTELNGLIVMSGHDFPLVLGGAKNGKVEFNEWNFECLKHCDHLTVMTFDPLVSIHQCNENSNSEMDPIIKRLGALAAESKLAIHLIHHPKKSSNDITGGDTRGASATFDGVRGMRVLNTMTEAEAQRCKIENRRHYFRESDEKANYTALSSVSKWYRHEPVRLDNGDVVGVVVAWRAPGPLDNVTKEQTRQVQDIVRDGAYRSDSQSEMWVGQVVADVLDLNVKDETDCGQIKAILKRWYDDGVLLKTTRRDKRRHLVMAVTAGKR